MQRGVSEAPLCANAWHGAEHRQGTCSSLGVRKGFLEEGTSELT